MTAAFLLLVDARLPTGGHAHSGGMEEAVAGGAVTGVADLGAWLAGRLHTVGLVDAAFAAAAHTAAAAAHTAAVAAHTAAVAPHLPAGATSPGPWPDMDAEWGARTVSPALRAAGRAQGRGLLRAARACWPDARLDRMGAALPGGAPWPLAVGATGAVAGCRLEAVTAAAAAASVTGPAWATTRLLGTDPFEVAAILAGLGPAVDEVAAVAVGYGRPRGSVADLPALSAPLLDLGAERHATWEVRLFAS